MKARRTFCSRRQMHTKTSTHIHQDKSKHQVRSMSTATGAKNDTKVDDDDETNKKGENRSPRQFVRLSTLRQRQRVRLSQDRRQQQQRRRRRRRQLPGQLWFCFANATADSPADVQRLNALRSRRCATAVAHNCVDRHEKRPGQLW